MFWALATAASLSAPAPLNYIFYSGDDMPAYHQMAGVTRITYIRLTVRPDATLQTCEVEDNGGDPKLGAFSCELAMQRARFAPARWIDGSPTYGVYRRTVTWAIDFPPPAKSLRGDLEIKVSSFPKGERSPTFVRVMFASAASGELSSCTALPPAIPSHQNNPTLVPAACEELIKTYTALPARDGTGSAVPSVQNAVVKFIKDSAKRH